MAILQVSVDVENIGKRAGDEVVQLYIRDVAASMTRPVKELKGFQRITCSRARRSKLNLPSRRSSLASTIAK